jgi:hypothetical protein
MIDLGDSMNKDVVNHQIALLNLCSADVNYALKSNFPFYIEQRDLRASGSHLKSADTNGTATTGGQGSSETEITVGATHGRIYGEGLNPPAFIAPPSEPLHASLSLQDKLEAEIRKLVNLAVSNLSSRQSAESKIVDNQGLEAGLSYIGLQLENAERQIAEHWAAYEEKNPLNRDIAVIKYPDVYSLKTDAERVKEASDLVELMTAVPGRKIKRELAKSIVHALLNGKISLAALEDIYDEIDKTPYTTSDPDTIVLAVQTGLCGEKTASMALGFDDDEYKQAREDHALRATRILQAQTDPTAQGGLQSDPASRGVPDLSSNLQAGKEERAKAVDPTLDASKTPKVRGKANA